MCKPDRSADHPPIKWPVSQSKNDPIGSCIFVLRLTSFALFESERRGRQTSESMTGHSTFYLLQTSLFRWSKTMSALFVKQIGSRMAGWKGLGHKSISAEIARDPTSLAFARSGFRVLHFLLSSYAKTALLGRLHSWRDTRVWNLREPFDSTSQFYICPGVPKSIEVFHLFYNKSK
jgi:hypothetical protein